MKKNKITQFRLTEKEFISLSNHATKKGMTVSELIRFYLRKILNKGK